MKLGETQPFASPEEVLEHHGVKGMKWGVRKQDDLVGRVAAKPDSSGALESVKTKLLGGTKEQRTEKFLNRADVMGTKASELHLSNEVLAGTRNPIKLYERATVKSQIKALEQDQKRALKDAEAVHKGKLTSKQKKVIAGAVVVGVLGAGAIYMRGQQSGAFNSYALRGAAFLRGEKTPFAMNPKLSRSMSVNELLHEVAKPVNPGYSKAGGKMNCRRSTYAYELRRRGFDVHATTSAHGWGQSESGVINALTPGGRNFYRQMSMSQAVVNTGFSSVARGDTRVNPLKKILLDGLINETPSFQEQARAIRENGGRMPHHLSIAIANAGRSNSAKVLEELAKQPNGSRGEVLFKFSRFGHSMAYEVVDGVPHIFDSQKGTLYNASTKMVESKWDGFTAAEITRLDNVDLDLKFLSRWATNVGAK